MKELTIKQKAKAYDEAIKKASIAYKDEDRHFRATLERIFPELKESEDEKIRKELTKFLKSAPHGAGRLLSRSKAKELLAMEDFKVAMDGIYTTSVCENTIDEAPMVYKPMDEIIECVEPTVYIMDVIKPIYNFKAK